MKSKTMILLVVAAACGLVASYMTSRLLADRNQKVQVLVAKAKFPSWTSIKKPEEMFDVEERSKGEVPRNAVTSAEATKNHILAKSLEKGEVVIQDYLENEKESALDVKLPPGKRALAVRTTQEGVAGGFVLPGSHVDVIHTIRRGDRGPESRVILQNVPVLAVDQLDRKPDEKMGVVPATVTLMLDPDQVQIITRAQSEGVLMLALRSKGDSTEVVYQDPNPPKAPEPPKEEEPKEPVVVKEPEPPAPPIERKTLTVHNGNNTIRATFTTQNGETRTDIERTQNESAAPRPQPTPQPVPVPPPASQPAPNDGNGSPGGS
jgi:pilus assembly protein CpaB